MSGLPGCRRPAGATRTRVSWAWPCALPPPSGSNARRVGGPAVPASSGLLGEARSGLEGRVRRLVRKETDPMLRLSFARRLFVALFLGAVGGMLTVAGVRAAEPSPQASVIEEEDKK